MSLYQQILSSLSSAPTQNNRLLELHTPLGTNVLVAERADIEEAIGPSTGPQPAQSDGSFDGSVVGCRVVVHALAADGHIELKSLIGQPALLNLLTAQSRTTLRPFHGHITQAALLGSDGGLARYRLVIEPWLSFLAHRTDAYVFQSKTVIQIIEEVFADYQAQGKLMPAWRWDLADATVYPERSLSIEYQESDLAFVQRLLIEEGLFCWIEHQGNANDASLGSHTLVIADHNNAFQAGAQERVRFTQATTAGGSPPTTGRSALFKSAPQDSLTSWSRSSAVHTASVELASLDYRAVSLRPQSQSADAQFIAGEGASALPDLSLSDIPGVYAFEDSDQGARLALRQMQALDAQREQVQAQGNMRTAAPGTTFSLLDHAEHDGTDDARDRFIILSAQHHARSNLSADQQAQVNSLLGAIDAINTLSTKRGEMEAEGSATPSNRNNRNHSKAPVYQCRIQAQRAAVPVRLGGVDKSGLPDVRLHPRPTLQGVQTAVVVGITGQPVHTDRDQRIKVQFHWQRGSNASHRLIHPADDNAPASDATGVSGGSWLRVAQSVAGANWGAVFTPRLGQEVLVQFVAGDVDRPVVVGVLYNGQGSADAQGNQVAGGAASATGNAAAWFPGDKKQGKLQGHQHNAVLSGYKSQELSASQSGTGGYNQLVFDDSAGAWRIELSSTSSATRLQLGHLLHQADNQRLQPRGHGLDLSSAAWGALRAGSVRAERSPRSAFHLTS